MSRASSHAAAPYSAPEATSGRVAHSSDSAPATTPTPARRRAPTGVLARRQRTSRTDGDHGLGPVPLSRHHQPQSRPRTREGRRP